MNDKQPSKSEHPPKRRGAIDMNGPGRGRPKGAQNKMTKAAKQAIEEAFTGLGGVAALKRWAESNPEAFYTKVWVKILPLSVNANVTSVPLTDEERRAIIAEAFASGR